MEIDKCERKVARKRVNGYTHQRTWGEGRPLPKASSRNKLPPGSWGEEGKEKGGKEKEKSGEEDEKYSRQRRGARPGGWVSSEQLGSLWLVGCDPLRPRSGETAGKSRGLGNHTAGKCWWIRMKISIYLSLCQVHWMIQIG